jgi:hypothetical protein
MQYQRAKHKTQQRFPVSVRILHCLTFGPSLSWQMIVFHHKNAQVLLPEGASLYKQSKAFLLSDLSNHLIVVCCALRHNVIEMSCHIRQHAAEADLPPVSPAEQ